MISVPNQVPEGSFQAQRFRSPPYLPMECRPSGAWLWCRPSGAGEGVTVAGVQGFRSAPHPACEGVALPGLGYGVAPPGLGVSVSPGLGRW